LVSMNKEQKLNPLSDEIKEFLETYIKRWLDD
jgi:hypothetical protein